MVQRTVFYLQSFNDFMTRNGGGVCFLLVGKRGRYVYCFIFMSFDIYNG